MTADRWLNTCIFIFGAVGLLRSIEGDNVAPAVWACGIVLLLILRELADSRPPPPPDTTS